MQFLVVILVLIVPGVALAQEQCPGCVMGVFDDAELSRNFGFWDATNQPVKTIWVGVKFDTYINEMVGVELSVDGIGEFCPGPADCFSFSGLVEPSVTIGPTIASPDDKTNGVGGVNIVWDRCLVGDRAFVKVELSSSNPIPSDVVLRVTRKFPPSDIRFPEPLFTGCGLIFPRVTITGGCYVIDPSVRPGETVEDCTLAETTAVESLAWSMIKLRYR